MDAPCRHDTPEPWAPPYGSLLTSQCLLTGVWVYIRMTLLSMHSSINGHTIYIAISIYHELDQLKNTITYL